MDATNFVEKISQLVPNKQDILRNTTCSEEFATFISKIYQ